ncbi:MAG: hypothetical protein R3D55_02280 [Chloroflexota bacterium]
MIKKSFRLFLLLGSMVALTLSFYHLVMAEPEAPDAPTSAPNWNTPVTISSGDSGARLPSIASAPNSKEVIVAYVSQRSGVSTNTDPYYRASSNFGATFPSPPAPINTNGSTETIDVSVTFDSLNRAHALWIEETVSNSRQLRYAREDSWPSTSSLRASVASPGVLFTPRIVASGSSTIDIVWAGDTSGIITDIYHSRSTNNGSTWPISGVVFDTMDLSQSPDFAVGNGIIHLVWSEGLFNSKIYYTRGTVSGSTVSWSARVAISDQSGATNAVEPSIYVSGSTIHVSYTNRPSESQQTINYLRCNSGCTNLNNWISSNNPVSGTFVGANIGDPFDVASSVIQLGNCTYMYFHGVQSGQTNEQILGVNSCGNWSSSKRDEVTSSSTRALNPDFAMHNNWWLYLVYENKSGGYIVFQRNTPAIYLPTILR